MTSKVIQARVPDQIYTAASLVIQANGLSVSDVMREVMTRIAREQSLPLDMFQPNAQTLQAMHDARLGRTEPTSIEAIVSAIHEAQTDDATPAVKH